MILYGSATSEKLPCLIISVVQPQTRHGKMLFGFVDSTDYLLMEHGMAIVLKVDEEQRLRYMEALDSSGFGAGSMIKMDALKKQASRLTSLDSKAAG